ncbi:MAG: PAS domain S-box protein, partial [Bacteroidota bacterium]
KIIEDSKGNLWFWDQDEDFPAIKYDGDTFTYFRISSNIDAEMTEDEEGKIVFTTREGLIRYNGVGFTVGLKSLSLWNTIVDKDNIYWLSGRKGLYRLDGTYLQHFTEEHGLPMGYIRFFSLDTSGQLWFFNNVASPESTQYLCKMSTDSISIFENLAFLGDKRILRVFSDSHNLIWISTSDGVVSYDGTYFTEITEREGMTFKSTMDMTEDTDGNIWVHSWESGINIIMRENFINYTGDPNLKYVESISNDSAGNIWIGVGGLKKSGLYKYDGSDLYYYDIIQGEAFRITEIMEDSKKQLWVGDWGKELYCFDGEEVRAYRIDKGSSTHTTVTSISEQANGDIWIGTHSSGIYRFDGSEFIHYNIRSYQNDEPSHLINMVYSSFVDSKDNVWFGTDEGIALYTSGKFYDYSSIINTSEALVLSIYEDDEENVWFGTKGEGVFKYDGIRTTHYDERNGLSDSDIRSITGDEFGGIWLGTSKGLYYINQNQNDEYLVDSAFLFKSFGRLNGLLGLAFYSASVANDQNGKIWWGNKEGLTVMTQHPFGKTLTPPKLTLVNIEVANTFIDYRLPEGNSDEDSIGAHKNLKSSLYSKVQFTGLLPYFNVPTNLTLPYELARIKFQFTGTDWDAPNDILYQTRLIGLDQEWSALTSINDIEYTSLSHGDYTFTARAIGKSGVWSKPLEYNFTILPPWWHTWWARTIYGLLFILLIILIVHLRTRSLLKRHKLLQKSEEKYRGVFDSITDIFLRADKEGNCILISPSIFNVLGYTVEEVMGKNLSTFYTNPTDRDELVQKLKEKGSLQNYEVKLTKKDGSIITGSSNIRFIFDTEGNPIYIESVFRDVTEQKKVENNLKESEEKFRGVFNSMTDVFTRADNDGRGVLLSPSLFDVTGYKVEKLIGRKFTDVFVNPKDRELIEQKLMNSGGIQNFEYDIFKKDGSIITISSNAKLYYDDDGNPLGIESVFRDVTEQKRTEAALRESKVRYQSLSDASFEAIFISEKGVCIEQNALAEKMFGYTLSEAVGRKGIEWIVPEDREMVMNKMLSGYDAQPYETTALRKDGSTFPAEIKARMMHFKGRDVRVTALSDISRRKLMEKELKDSEHKFKTLVTNTEEIVYMIDKDGTFLLSEGKGLEKLGLKGGDVVGKSIYELYKDFPEMLDKMRQAFSGQTVIMEHEVGDNWFKSWYTPHLNQNGEIIGLLGLAINITEQKHAELQIMEYQKRLKDLALDLTLAEEKTRKQIANDLHDHVGQLLASSRMQLSTINDEMDKLEVSKKIKNISKALLLATQATREAIFNLSPPQLHEIGLYAAIHDWMKEQIEIKYGIKTAISGKKENYNLDENTRFLIFRSIRELMINVTKHARAAHLNIEMNRKKDMLEILVQDDGVGFDYNSKLFRLKSKSYGLFSIQERMSDLGGSMKIISAPGFGTKIKLVIPFRA